MSNGYKQWYAFQRPILGQMPLVMAFKSKTARERWINVFPEDRRPITYVEKEAFFSPKYREEHGPVRFRTA